MDPTATVTSRCYICDCLSIREWRTNHWSSFGLPRQTKTDICRRLNGEALRTLKQKGDVGCPVWDQNKPLGFYVEKMEGNAEKRCLPTLHHTGSRGVNFPNEVRLRLGYCRGAEGVKGEDNQEEEVVRSKWESWIIEAVQRAVAAATATKTTTTTTITKTTTTTTTKTKTTTTTTSTGERNAKRPRDETEAVFHRGPEDQKDIRGLGLQPGTERLWTDRAWEGTEAVLHRPHGGPEDQKDIRGLGLQPGTRRPGRGQPLATFQIAHVVEGEEVEALRVAIDYTGWIFPGPGRNRWLVPDKAKDGSLASLANHAPKSSLDCNVHLRIYRQKGADPKNPGSYSVTLNAGAVRSNPKSRCPRVGFPLCFDYGKSVWRHVPNRCEALLLALGLKEQSLPEHDLLQRVDDKVDACLLLDLSEVRGAGGFIEKSLKSLLRTDSCENLKQHVTPSDLESAGIRLARYPDVKAMANSDEPGDDTEENTLARCASVLWGPKVDLQGAPFPASPNGLHMDAMQGVATQAIGQLENNSCEKLIFVVPHNLFPVFSGWLRDCEPSKEAREACYRNDLLDGRVPLENQGGCNALRPSLREFKRLIQMLPDENKVKKRAVFSCVPARSISLRSSCAGILPVAAWRCLFYQHWRCALGLE